MTSKSLTCVLFLYALIYSSAAEEDPQCKTTISVFKFDAKSLSSLQDGAKGEKGDRGLHNIDGRGEPGEIGIPSEATIYGEKGDVGLIGPRGITGARGEKGDKGEMGEAMRNGLVGVRGPKGEKGITDIGPPGPPGDDGTCICDKKWTPGNHTDDRIEEETCDGIKVKETGEHIISSKNISIVVQCVVRNETSTLTCILPPKELKTYSFKNNTGTGFWLSSLGFKLDELYNINRNNIGWFQQRSNSAFQTIRFHCYNTMPFRRDDVDKSVLLLTWNDKTIGPIPTMTKPFYYSVLNDGCANYTKDTWSYTDIKLLSSTTRRVPVIDFYMRDIAEDITLDQRIKIETIEFCFD